MHELYKQHAGIADHKKRIQAIKDDVKDMPKVDAILNKLKDNQLMPDSILTDAISESGLCTIIDREIQSKITPIHKRMMRSWVLLDCVFGLPTFIIGMVRTVASISFSSASKTELLHTILNGDRENLKHIAANALMNQAAAAKNDIDGYSERLLTLAATAEESGENLKNELLKQLAHDTLDIDQRDEFDRQKLLLENITEAMLATWNNKVHEGSLANRDTAISVSRAVHNLKRAINTKHEAAPKKAETPTLTAANDTAANDAATLNQAAPTEKQQEAEAAAKAKQEAAVAAVAEAKQEAEQEAATGEKAKSVDKPVPRVANNSDKENSSAKPPPRTGMIGAKTHTTGTALIVGQGFKTPNLGVYRTPVLVEVTDSRMRYSIPEAIAIDLLDEVMKEVYKRNETEIPNKLESEEIEFKEKVKQYKKYICRYKPLVANKPHVVDIDTESGEPEDIPGLSAAAMEVLKDKVQTKLEKTKTEDKYKVVKAYIDIKSGNIEKYDEEYFKELMDKYITSTQEKEHVIINQNNPTK